MDASTLGKIELVGPDVATFLDRIYTNRMSTLAVGSIRYGLMLGLDGMVFDDGVAMRLAEDRYLITTTTGGAAKVMDHVEEWLQTEWPDLRVYATSVTEQWATIAVNGPQARDVLAALGTDIDLDAAAFPFMTWRDGDGRRASPARVARVSFSGELAYEINVAGAPRARDVGGRDGRRRAVRAHAVRDRGDARAARREGLRDRRPGHRRHGHAARPRDVVDRAARTTPTSSGGARSAGPTRPAPTASSSSGCCRPIRGRWLPEGAQLVARPTPRRRRPCRCSGHVTSSYRSPILERTFALAMVKGGRDLHRVDDRVAATTDGPIEAEVTAPVFYDPEGARRDG